MKSETKKLQRKYEEEICALTEDLKHKVIQLEKAIL